MIRSLTCGMVIYDEITEIQNLIPKLKMELKDYEVEWIFVLNHEQLEIRKWIANWIKDNIQNAMCFENPSNNLGFARQLVLEKSKTEYVYLTDPDIDLVKGNLKKLIQLANTELTNDINIKYAGFGGTVTHKSNNHFLQSTFDFMSKLSKLIPLSFQIQNHSHLVAVDHLPACHLLLNKDIALRIGGFSSALSKCGEDLDFTHRAYNLEYRFIFLPAAQVIHWQNLSLAKWFYKMFTLGRIQIPVQKMNFKQGLRFYRLIPLIGLITLIAYSVFNYYFLLFILASISLISLINIGFLGFFLTLLSYSSGELFELILPIFEYKNDKQLTEVNSNLQSQFYESKKDN
ncbi:MAG: glycosyltransferase [Pseudobdellovibrio sp.]